MFDRQSIHVAMLMWGCIFNLIAALCTFIGTNFDSHKRHWLLAMQLSCAALLFCDSLAWAYRGEAGNIGYWIVRLSNFFVFLISDELLFIFNSYVCCYLFETTPFSKQPRRWINAVYIIALLGCALVILSQFTNLYYWIDSANLYHRSAWHPLSLLIPLAGLLIDTGLIIKYRRNLSKPIFVSFLSYLALPVLALIALLFFYGISLENIAIAISMILIFVSSLSEQNHKAAIQASELTESRISLLLSQIQPHFIYNTLGSIHQLCLTQPKQAADLTLEFSNYLRGNLEELRSAHPIPLSKELEQIQHYVHIEEVRFPDISVKFDLKSKNFMVPALSIQPLVENAIKHGLRGLDSGGTVTISSWETDSLYVIKIQDDGIGFDPDAPLPDDRQHIGISNIRFRLDKMCNGKLYISSTPGKGTAVIVEIPKENAL